MDDRQRQFWNEARAACDPPLRDAPDAVRTLGNSQPLSITLVDLVLRGEKTGTFSLPVDFEAGTGPAAGHELLLCDHDGAPHAVLVLDEVATRAFGDISADDIACEGPGLRDLDRWRELHWAYWQSVLEPHGRQPSMDMPVIFQRFRVRYPIKR